MTTIKGQTLTVLFVAVAGIALGVVGIISPMAFGMIFTVGAILVLALIVASFILDAISS